ncbi:MAG: transcriptional repressor [Sporichthyaceae bacterium]|nr:transcriptional repressor [Sporichthyaceae bacterium]
MAEPLATSVAAAATLRAAGLRVTRPRLAVIAALAEHPHAPVEPLVQAVRTRIGTVSVQAVYDVLRTLGSAGLVRRIDLAGAPSRYELRVGDNHHHVVCRQCGTTVDVDCAVGEAPCLDPADAAGFVVDEAEVTYWGTCPACQVSATTTITPTPASKDEGAP